MYLGPIAPDPGRFYKLLIVDTGQSGHGMSHYHYGQIVLGMPRLDHILLLRKCVYIRLILRKLLWTLNEWCFQKKEEHKKAIPNAHICASGGGHNLGARACKACRYFLYVLLVTLPENSAYWHLTSNWGCEYNEICWVTNCREPLNLIEIHLAASGGVEASPAGRANISSLPSFMKWLHQLELATFAIWQ